MNGILLIDKEKGITSRDVVNKLNKILNTKKPVLEESLLNRFLDVY